MAYDEKLAERIRKALAGRPEVVEKKMFGGLAFMVRGRMSCGIVGSSLMVRVDPEDADALLRERGAHPMDFTGRPMRGFLFVDPPGIATSTALGKWVGRAVAHAEAQPPKGGKRAAAMRRRVSAETALASAPSRRRHSHSAQASSRPTRYAAAHVVGHVGKTRGIGGREGASPPRLSFARIYATVSRVPPGRVATYGQVARLSGLPGHARLVGYALAALRDGSGVPWHRVVSAAGRVSPRSSGDPADVLQRLRLEREGVRFDPSGHIRLARFQWRPRSRGPF